MPAPLLVSLALFTLSVGLSGQGTQLAPTEAAQSDRVEGWRADLDFLYAKAQSDHASPMRPAFSQEFEEQAAELRLSIPELSDDQVLAGMMRLLAILNDGHTAIHAPRPESKLDFTREVLPFKFYAFPSGIYIVDGAGDWIDYAGSRVLRFVELAAEEVLARMRPYRGVDNEMNWTWLGPEFYLRRISLLREVGVPVEGATVSVTILTPEGREETLSVGGGSFELVRKLRPFALSPDDPPLYLSNVDTNYWMQALPEQDAVYVQFNQVRDAPLESIEAFSERLRRELREGQARHLIVDVRHNNGGNNTLLRPLVRALIEFDMRSPENRLFVLIGRGTFSAAQNFINRVERWTSAVFVGESSSSCPNFVGESNEFVLPFSRVSGSISNRYWQDSEPWDRRQAIEVDIPVSLTSEQYFTGRDPVLERVLDEL